jgi:DNA-binding response OmpR family regulator
MKNGIAGRILYVEDDADIREMATFVLTRANYEVVQTGSCDQAVRLAKGDQFDLYLIDNTLPDCSGISLCHRLREFDSGTPVLFCSGLATDADRKAALDCGSQGYLIKPFNHEQLLSEVAGIVSESSKQ